MRILDSFRSGQPAFSFEFFPPKTEEGVRNLYEAVEDLAPLNPAYVSVTYGAGGTTRDLTLDLTSRIKREVGLEAMAHLTCVGHTSEEIGVLLDQLWDAGIENVLALRGDPPRGQSTFQRTEGGFAYAQELVRFIRGNWGFCLGGASYPERHVESLDSATDLQRTREKVDSGVDFLITQLFFDPELYFAHVRDLRSLGVEVPVVPGVMPITNVSQVERFTTLCGATIPAELARRLDAVRHDDAAVVQCGIDWAVSQCRALLDGGAPGIHFYTLNRSHSTRVVCSRLRESV